MIALTLTPLTLALLGFGCVLFGCTLGLFAMSLAFAARQHDAEIDYSDIPASTSADLAAIWRRSGVHRRG